MMNSISTFAVPGAPTPAGSESPQQPPVVAPKNVQFQLLIAESHRHRARLTMRVQIYPHDTTDSIVTTVKNFFGIYPTPTNHVGVSFEDEERNTLIARYENFRDHMIVYVRTTEGPPLDEDDFGPASSYSRPVGLDSLTSQPHQRPGHNESRPDTDARSSRRRSPSPLRNRSVSTHTNKGRSRSGKRGGEAYCDSLNEYSSGDNGSTTSARAKDPIPNTEISVENIVEGGRRKRAKFESSELPLFAPLQMPASTSNPSVSPARRADHHHRPSLPFGLPGQGQNPFMNAHPLESPLGYTGHIYSTPGPDSRRSRGSISYPGAPNGVLPTPDPTVGSCMSEEDKDVAIQLMRLGDMSNVSHGRTSASTLDDTFSGRADATSSTGATSDGGSDSEDEHPVVRRQKLGGVSASRSIYPTTEGHFVPLDANLQGPSPISGAPRPGDQGAKLPAPGAVNARPKTSLPTSKPKVPKVKGARPGGVVKNKKPIHPPHVAHDHGGPMSPPSIPPPRKQPVVSGILLPATGEDDAPDLSTKPRCQRCRKSKKGCDRQRPCGRCSDAGLTEDQCISEDEGNGRKGRYGRHMGVPIKKEELPPAPPGPVLLPAAPIAGDVVMAMDDAAMAADKNKKRKR